MELETIYNVEKVNYQSDKKKKKMTIRERIKTCTYNDPVLNDWLDKTTVHGIVHVFKAKSPIRRIFWILIFITAFGGCTYNVLERFYYRLTFPTATTSTFEFDEAGVPFPAVTICNMNSIKRSYAEENNLTAVIDLLYSPFVATGNTEECNGVLNSTQSAKSNASLHTIFDEGQLSREEFIIKCSFGGDSTTDDYKNCVTDFEPIYTKVGKCYTFNSGLNGADERYVKVNGQRFGLRLVLNIHQEEYLSPLNSNAGIKVSVQPQGVVPLPEEQGVSIPPGRNAYIDLNLEEVTDQTEENGCIGQTEYGRSFNLRHFSDFTYTINTCKANSYVDSIANECGCLDAIGGRESSKRNCTLRDVCCIDSVYSDQTRAPTCPAACSTKRYHKFISYAQYPSLSTVGTVADYFNISTKEVEQNLIALDIYFQETDLLKTVTVYSYDNSALLSDLGGQLGLFLGASVISMLEFILFVFDDFKRICCTRKFKKAVSKVENKMAKHVPQFTLTAEESDHEDDTTSQPSKINEVLY